jgi:hypothetical protein
MKVRINRIREEKGIIFSSAEKDYIDALRTWCYLKKISFCFLNSSKYDKKIKEIISDFSAYSSEIAFSNDRIRKENETFLIISGFENKLLNQFLEFLRNNNIKIPYKCTVTQTNKEWTVRKTVDEIKKEHLAMHSQE